MAKPQPQPIEYYDIQPPSHNPLYFIYIVARCWFASVECIVYRIFTDRYADGSLIDGVSARTLDILRINHTHPTYDPKTDMVLTNHRTIFDPMVSQQGCSGISRGMYMLLLGPMGWIAMWCGQIITISRGKTDRKALYGKIKSVSAKNGGLPALIYPEGTRCRHMSLPENADDIDLKPGSLKMMYEHGMVFQIYIHRGIETAGDERTWRIQHGVDIVGHLTTTYDPVEWKDRGDSFETFYHDVKCLWREAWYEVYDDVDENGGKKKTE
jgi:hypothetical protein